MDERIKAAIEALLAWCCKGRAALENRDIPPQVPAFKFHMLEMLEGVELWQNDSRVAELLVCLDYWCKQPLPFSRIYPNADPVSAKAAKSWFAGRAAIILGKPGFRD